MLPPPEVVSKITYLFGAGDQEAELLAMRKERVPKVNRRQPDGSWK